MESQVGFLGFLVETVTLETAIAEKGADVSGEADLFLRVSPQQEGEEDTGA